MLGRNLGLVYGMMIIPLLSCITRSRNPRPAAWLLSQENDQASSPEDPRMGKLFLAFAAGLIVGASAVLGVQAFTYWPDTPNPAPVVYPESESPPADDYAPFAAPHDSSP